MTSRYWSVTVITCPRRVRPSVGSISLTGNAPSPIDGVNRSLTRPARHRHVGTLEAAAVADATPVSPVNRGPRAMSVTAASEQGAQEAAANVNLYDRMTLACEYVRKFFHSLQMSHIALELLHGLLKTFVRQVEYLMSLPVCELCQHLRDGRSRRRSPQTRCHTRRRHRTSPTSSRRPRVPKYWMFSRRVTPLPHRPSLPPERTGTQSRLTRRGQPRFAYCRRHSSLRRSRRTANPDSRSGDHTSAAGKRLR